MLDGGAERPGTYCGLDTLGPEGVPGTFQAEVTRFVDTPPPVPPQWLRDLMDCCCE